MPPCQLSCDTASAITLAEHVWHTVSDAVDSMRSMESSGGSLTRKKPSMRGWLALEDILLEEAIRKQPKPVREVFLNHEVFLTYVYGWACLSHDRPTLQVLFEGLPSAMAMRLPERLVRLVGRGPLHMALIRVPYSARAEYETIELLQRQWGVHPNQRDSCFKGNALLALLSPQLPAADGVHDPSPAKAERASTVKLLLDAGVAVNEVGTEELRQTALHLAVVQSTVMDGAQLMLLTSSTNEQPESNPVPDGGPLPPDDELKAAGEQLASPSDAQAQDALPWLLSWTMDQNLPWPVPSAWMPIVYLLLDAGALPDAEDLSSQTPLLIAARMRHAGVIGVLLSHPATQEKVLDMMNRPSLRYPGVAEFAGVSLEWSLLRGCGLCIALHARATRQLSMLRPNIKLPIATPQNDDEEAIQTLSDLFYMMMDLNVGLLPASSPSSPPDGAHTIPCPRPYCSHVSSDPIYHTWHGASLLRDRVYAIARGWLFAKTPLYTPRAGLGQPWACAIIALWLLWARVVASMATLPKRAMAKPAKQQRWALPSTAQEFVAALVAAVGALILLRMQTAMTHSRVKTFFELVAAAMLMWIFNNTYCPIRLLILAVLSLLSAGEGWHVLSACMIGASMCVCAITEANMLLGWAAPLNLTRPNARPCRTTSFVESIVSLGARLLGTWGGRLVCFVALLSLWLHLELLRLCMQTVSNVPELAISLANAAQLATTSLQDARLLNQHSEGVWRPPMIAQSVACGDSYDPPQPFTEPRWLLRPILSVLRAPQPLEAPPNTLELYKLYARVYRGGAIFLLLAVPLIYITEQYITTNATALRQRWKALVGKPGKQHTKRPSWLQRVIGKVGSMSAPTKTAMRARSGGDARHFRQMLWLHIVAQLLAAGISHHLAAAHRCLAVGFRPSVPVAMAILVVRLNMHCWADWELAMYWYAQLQLLSFGALVMWTFYGHLTLTEVCTRQDWQDVFSRHHLELQSVILFMMLVGAVSFGRQYLALLFGLIITLLILLLIPWYREVYTDSPHSYYREFEVLQPFSSTAGTAVFSLAAGLAVIKALRTGRRRHQAVHDSSGTGASDERQAVPDSSGTGAKRQEAERAAAAKAEAESVAAAKAEAARLQAEREQHEAERAAAAKAEAESVAAAKAEAARLQAEQNEEDLKLCIICFEEPKNVVAVPCFHVSICKSCADMLQPKVLDFSLTCPVCRVPVDSLHKVYL